VVQIRRKKTHSLIPFLKIACLGFIGYATVWNLNYLFAYVSLNRLHDPILLQIDLAVYSWLFGQSVSTAMFPLFRCEGCFQLLESAYVVLFAEIFAVIFVLHKNGYSAHLFLRSLFLCYFVGLLVFVLFPAVGPVHLFPRNIQFGLSQYSDL
jgi:hypothetical protein